MALIPYPNGSLSLGFHANLIYEGGVNNKPAFKRDFGKDAIDDMKAWLATQGVNDINDWPDMTIPIEDADNDGMHTHLEIAAAINQFINPNQVAMPEFRLDIDETDVRYVWYDGKRVCLHAFMLLKETGNQYISWKLPNAAGVRMQVWITLSWPTAINTATGDAIPPGSNN